MSAPPRPDAATQPTGRGRSRPTGPLRWLAALLLTALAAVAVVPDLLFGMDRYPPFVQTIAFRPVWLAGLVAVVVVVALLTLWRHGLWPTTAGLAVVAVLGAAMVLPRTVADAAPTSGRPLKVLALNVYEGRADVDSLAALIRTEAPDVVSIPEAGGRFAGELEPLIAPLGYRTLSSMTGDRPDVAGVTLGLSGRMGEVQTRFGRGRTFPFVEVTGGGLGSLHVVAYHTVAPTRGEIDQWREGLDLLREWCAGPAPAVLAGDFNATLDHSVLRAGTAGCEDAAAQTGRGLAGTWPNWAPLWLGPQIDHVFGTARIAAESFDMRDVPGTDHRAIVTTLRVP